MKELIKGEKYFIEAKFLYLDNRPRGDGQRCREDASGLTMFLNKCNVWSERVIVTFPKQKTKVQKLLAELSSEEIDELKGLM